MNQFDLKIRMWEQYLPSHEITRKSVTELIENRIPAIIISNFLSESNCNDLILSIIRAGMSKYTHVNSKVMKFGAVQAEFNSPEKKEDYFKLSRHFEPIAIDLFKNISTAPVDFLKDKLSHLFETTACVANEANLGNYFAGTFRNIEGPGFIHFDFAKQEAPGWAISEVSAQLSWNLYLNDEFEGGELKVYERQWNQESEEFKVHGCYSYADDVVKKWNSFEYKPRKGDLVLFNSRNFHEITSPSASRLTQSSFIGVREDSSFWFWS